MFLRVGITKYYKLQRKLLPGSATVSAHTSRGLINTARTPTDKSVWGNTPIIKECPNYYARPLLLDKDPINRQGPYY